MHTSPILILTAHLCFYCINCEMMTQDYRVCVRRESGYCQIEWAVPSPPDMQVIARFLQYFFFYNIRWSDGQSAGWLDGRSVIVSYKGEELHFYLEGSIGRSRFIPYSYILDDAPTHMCALSEPSFWSRTMRIRSS